MAAWIITAGLALAAGVDLGDPDATVVMRASDGQFLAVAEDGSLQPAGFCPEGPPLFALFEREGDRIAIRAPDGRFLAPAPADARRILATAVDTELGDTVSFRLVPADGNLAAFESCGTGEFVVLDAHAPESVEELAEKPGPQQCIAPFRYGEVPPPIQSALAMAIRTIVQRELGDKEYSKVTRHSTNRYVTLPAPTLKEPRRKKRHQILGVPEEYRVRAQLNEEPEVTIVQMLYLTGYVDQASKAVLFSIEARLPVRGQVSYKVPKLLSATTNYEATVALTLCGEMRFGTASEQAPVTPFELHQVHVSMHRLDLSNDVLQTMRRPIERAINGELRDNRKKICAKANEQVAKAIQGNEFRHPLLRYLGFP